MNEEPDEQKKKEAEELLRQLDIQLAMQRSKSQSAAGNRSLYRLLGILFLLGFTAIMVWGLFAFSSGVRSAAPTETVPESTE